MKRILPLIVLLLLSSALIITVIVVRNQTNLPGRAAGNGQLSLENSYLFASPLVSRASGEDKITVSAFVLSSQGRGLSGKKVYLYSAPLLIVNVVRDVTESDGMAVFEVATKVPGKYNVWAVVDGVDGGQIKQQVNISFTED